MYIEITRGMMSKVVEDSHIQRSDAEYMIQLRSLVRSIM